MTDKELDGLIREAFLYQGALQAAAARAGDAPLPELPERYVRWREKFLADPFRRARRAGRPVWRRAANTAAAVLLAAAVSFGALLAVSPDARAWVQRMVLHWFDDHAAFQFVGEDAAPDELGRWYPAWLPEGYELTEEVRLDIMVMTTYKNESNEEICIDYMAATGNQFQVNNEFHTLSIVEVNGYQAYLLMAEDNRYSNSITWLDEASETGFCIMASLGPEELIRIAESMEKNN